jgi:hypothetical protein
VSRAGVPEASIDEHCQALSGENDVGSHRNGPDAQRVIDTEAEASSMQEAPNREFGSRISAAIPGHPTRDGCVLRDWIGQRGHSRSPLI